MDRPLISYIVSAYNQERFIRDGVESAFAQTYTPLEIIISDDCSSDSTFRILQDLCSNYSGPHSVTLNRNSANLGFSKHLNRLMEMCHGDLVVVAAGDDISMPNRTEAIFEAWDQFGRHATSIFSSYTIVSEDGVVEGKGGIPEPVDDERPVRPLTGSLSNFLSIKKPAVNGCTHAWSPTLFRLFGPLSSDLEDLVLSFRSLAISELLYIHEPLVKYRRHGSNVSFLAERDDTRSFEHRERRLSWVNEKSIAAYDNMICDIQTLTERNLISPRERDRLKTEAQFRRSFYALEAELMGGSLSNKWRTLLRTAQRGNIRLAIRFLPRALPPNLYRRLFLGRDRWRRALQKIRHPKQPK